MINLLLLKCHRCGGEWASRKLNPKKCPRCNSPYWNRPRVDNNNYIYNKQVKPEYNSQLEKAQKWISELQEDRLNTIISTMAKWRVLDRHPTCHSMLEVVAEISKKREIPIDKLISDNKLPLNIS